MCFPVPTYIILESSGESTEPYSKREFTVGEKDNSILLGRIASKMVGPLCHGRGASFHHDKRLQEAKNNTPSDGESCLPDLVSSRKTKGDQAPHAVAEEVNGD